MRPGTGVFCRRREVVGGWSYGGCRGDVEMTKERRRRGGEASLVPAHGVYSGSVLAPSVLSLKRGLLARMGLRQRELSWAGRELLDTYCRAKAKVQAIDAWRS